MKHKNVETKNKDGKRKRVRDNAREWKKIRIFIIVRVIRHRVIRGDDNGDDDAERLTQNHSAGCHDYRSRRVTQIGICQKITDSKTKKKEQKASRRNETDYESIA